MLLYYITDRTQLAGTDVERRTRLLERIVQAAEAGVDWIQLREKDLSARSLARLAEEALRRIEPRRTKLLINSRLDVALAVGAAGVHLTSNDLAAGQARSVAAHSGIAASGFLVGVSCHSISEVRLAAGSGADFALLAPIFEKVLMPQTVTWAAQGAAGNAKLPGIGCEAIREASRSVSLSILALGGVTVANAGLCLAAGAAGVAAIRLFQEGDLMDTVRSLRALQP